uniref:Uncharacterized protein n=1 Tax=Haplochromis burtoni TaxID=8153 RepID=A0A3Q2VMC3_HAPBU
MSHSPDSHSLLSASSQLNLMEVDSIDDKEFDIPQVDTPPTLESILNELEDEEEPFVLEDTCILNTDNMDAHSCETSSLASSDSGDPSHLKRRKRTVDMSSTVHGCVLRHSLLKGISAQIVSAAVSCTSLCLQTVSGVIAVGTSHGLALVFDTNQALRLCLGTKTTGAEFGAVSALSINHDCSRLLCGFAKGQITMWDLANGKLLRTITDAHPPGTAILHVKVHAHTHTCKVSFVLLLSPNVTPPLLLLRKHFDVTMVHCTRQSHGHLYDPLSVSCCTSVSLQWINSRTLVLVDSHEKLHVVDRPSQEVLETLDLEQVQLVYNSRHFKSLATGGNVSQALVRV